MPLELGSILTGVEITEKKALLYNLLLTWPENICFFHTRSSILLGIISINTRHLSTTTLSVFMTVCVHTISGNYLGINVTLADCLASPQSAAQHIV